MVALQRNRMKADTYVCQANLEIVDFIFFVYARNPELRSDKACKSVTSARNALLVECLQDKFTS